MTRDLAIDIGGTNGRLRVVGTPAGEDVAQRVEGRTALLAFVRQGLDRLDVQPGAARLCIAIAGAVERRRRSRLPNWSREREVSIDDFASIGVDPGAVFMVNDLEAGAVGLLELLERRPDSDDLWALHAGDASGRGSRLLLAPGTGLGCAALIDLGADTPGPDWFVQPVESQNTPAAMLGGRMQLAADWMRAELSIERPTWEDFVSGRGLERLDAALAGRRGASALRSAKEIATAAHTAARTGADDPAREALELFYVALIGFAQMMALTFRPSGGVFLAGATTATNIEFLRGLPLHQWFADHARYHDILARMPMLAVTRDLNLDGAERLLRERDEPSVRLTA